MRLADKYNELIRNDLRNLGISYDLFTRTTTRNHARVVQDLFRTLHERGLHLRADHARRVLRRDRQHAARPLHRGNLPDLRLRARTRRPVRQLRQPARPDRLDRPALEDRRHGARVPRDDHLFLDLPAFTRPARASGSSDRSTGGRTSANFSLELARRAEAAADHARPRLGRPGSGRRLRGDARQADLRLDRRRHRLPLRRRRVGGEPRHSRRLARLVAGPRRAPRLLHGQGQHRLPHGHLAAPCCSATAREESSGPGAATLDAAGRRRRERVPDHGGQAVQREPGRRHLRQRLPRALRRGPAPLLPDRGRARDAGHRLHLGRVRPPQQRRARRDLGQPRQPHAHEHVPQLRRGSGARAS